MKDCVQALRAWLSESAEADSEPPFVSNRGARLSRDAVERIVRRYVELASDIGATLKGEHVSQQVLCHSAAMQLLQNGVDRTVIALWLSTSPSKAHRCISTPISSLRYKRWRKLNPSRSHLVAIVQAMSCSPFWKDSD